MTKNIIFSTFSEIEPGSERGWNSEPAIFGVKIQFQKRKKIIKIFQKKVKQLRSANTYQLYLP